MTAAGPISGRFVARFGTRPSIIVGGVLVAGGALALIGLTTASSLPLLLCAYALLGCGFGLVSPTIAVTAVASMPPARAGVAAAISTTSRQVGLTLGVAVFGVVTASGIHGGFRTAVAQATHPGWWIIAALGLAVAGAGYLSTTPWARATARRAATDLDQHERVVEPVVRLA